MIARLKPRRPRRWILSFLSVPVLYLILLIPGPGSSPPLPAGRKAFVWNQDQYWSALESRYVAARGTEKKYLIENIETGLRQSAILTSAWNKKQYLADDTLFDEIERNIFVLAPLVASCPQYLDKYVISIVRLRSAVKNQSRGWDMDALPVRDRMYRLLYGSRAATEEVL